MNISINAHWLFPGRRLCRAACALLTAAVSLCMPAWAQAQCAAPSWPLWEDWATRFVQQDGRMLFSSLKPNHSTSEGQAYGMFFALVANDPSRFDYLWKWTAANMQGGDRARLPGWLWGQGDDGQWQLQDANSASDADLWIAYALLEAARVWQRPAYRDDALQLLKTIESTLVVDLPGFGKTVLPGPQGFVQPDAVWRLNPSYLPVPLLRRLEKEAPGGPWKEIAGNTVKLIRSTSPQGYAADWVAYRGTSPHSGRFIADPIYGDAGSYDAIRVYLWAGMTPKGDAAAAPLLAALGGMAVSVAATDAPPEKVRTGSGATSGKAPFGFSAALVPYFIARGQTQLAEQLQRRAAAEMAAAHVEHARHAELLYYNVMLSLFSSGWAEKRYQFRRDGTLKLSWESSCVRANPR